MRLWQTSGEALAAVVESYSVFGEHLAVAGGERSKCGATDVVVAPLPAS
jgi:hypothetical protein